MNHEINCEQVKPALLEFLMEEISPEARRKVELHLQGCRTCSQEMAGLKQTISLLVRAEVSEDIPRRIRIVAEPAGNWTAFWRNPARLAFAGAGLMCVAIALLALFLTTTAYQNGSFQIAFGAPPASTEARFSGAPAAITADFTTRRPLEQAQVYEMISESMAASEREHQRQSQLMAKEISQRMEQRWQHELGEMAESLRYFQAAQTMLYKGQVQSEQLVSALMQQSGLPAPQQQ